MQRVDFKGQASAKRSNEGSKKMLKYLSTIRERFDNTAAIEKATRLEIVDVINKNLERGNKKQNRTVAELAILKQGSELFHNFSEIVGKVKARRTSIAESAKVYQSAETKGATWGHTEAIVRAPADHVLAHIWNAFGKSNRGAVLENTNAFSEVVLFPYAQQETGQRSVLVSRMVWKATSSKSSDFIVVSIPDKNDYGNVGLSTTTKPKRRFSISRDSAVSPHAIPLVRDECKFAVKLTTVSRDTTKLDCVAQVDSSSKNCISTIERVLEQITAIQEYFQMLLGVDDWTPRDGRLMGERMTTRSKLEAFIRRGDSFADVRMRDLFSRYDGLKQLGERYPFFEPMMARVVRNLLRPPSMVSTRLNNMSVMKAEAIGKSLAPSLAVNLTSDAAVDEWIMRYPAMTELDDKHAFFRPMMQVIAKDLLDKVGWGIKLRAFIGAAMSTLDLVSDVNVAAAYLASGDKGVQSLGTNLIIMIAVAFVLQTVVVYFQHPPRKEPLIFLREVVFVFSGLKAGVDATRISQDRSEFSTLDNKEEAVFHKGVELVAEAIPGCILQCYGVIILMEGGDTSWRSIVSIVISAVTTGFTSASISYDYDVDPKRRKETPSFYGYIPDSPSARSLIFLCMVAKSALLLLARSISAALFFRVNKSFVLYFYAGEMGLYLLQKTLRGDFVYWVPLQGAVAYLVAFVVRVAVKIIADFTGLVQFRHVNEIGGFYWSLSVFLAVLSPLLSLYFYLNDDKKSFAFETNDAWIGAGCLVGAWLFFFTLFMLLAKRKYWSTFFDRTTGWEYCCDRFLKGDSDFIKSRIFGYNNRQWDCIREEVRIWVGLNYWKWANDEEEWFNEDFRRKIPLDMIPQEAFDEQSSSSLDFTSSAGSSGGFFVRKRSVLKKVVQQESDVSSSNSEKRRNNRPAASGVKNRVAQKYAEHGAGAEEVIG